MKARTKIIKILSWSAIVLTVFILLLFVFLNSNYFQNAILKKFIASTSTELGVEIKYSDFKFSFPNKITLKEALIPDEKGDTLFYMGELSIGIKSYNRKLKRLTLDNGLIKDGYINFGVHEGEKYGNGKFFFTYLSSPKDPNKKNKEPLSVKFENIKIVNTTFRQFNENFAPPDDAAFNPRNIKFENMNGLLSNFTIVKDSLDFKINKFSAREHSGIKIEHFEALARIYSKGMEFDKLLIQTEKSSFGNKLYFKYDDWANLEEFVTDVEMEADVVNSFLDFEDLVPFGDAIKTISNIEVAFEGDYSGTIERMNLRNAVIKSLNNTIVKGNFDLRGLPDIDNTYLNFTFDEFRSNPIELFNILNLDISDAVRRLQTIGFIGKLNGFYNNFVTFGNVYTGLGNVTTDLNIDFRNGIDNALYSGEINSNSFDIGKMLDNKDLGDISLTAKLSNGIGLNPDKFSFEVDGRVSNFGVAKYNYKNIKLEGKFTESLFKGNAFVKDPNLDIDFEGTIDLTKGKEISDFNAQINKMNLKAMGIDTIESGVTGGIVLIAHGNDINNFTGSLHTFGLEAYRGEKIININELNIISDIDGGKREIDLSSDIIDISLTGEYNFKILPDAFQNFASNLLPGVVEPSKKKTPSERLDFAVNIKDPNKVLQLFTDDIRLGKGKISGAFNSQQKRFGLRATTDSLVLAGVKFDNLNFRAFKGLERDMKIISKSGFKLIGSKLETDSLNIDAVIQEGFLTYNLKSWKEDGQFSLNTNGNMSFASLDETTLFVKNLDTKIKGKEWMLKDSSEIIMGKAFMLNPLELVSNKESVKVEFISHKNSQKIELRLTNFQVSNINDFAPETYPDFFGLGNGLVHIHPFKSGMIEIKSDLTIQDFALGTDTIGTIELQTERINEFQNNINCEIKSGIFNGALLTGTLGNSDRFDDLNLNLRMPESDISIFNQFLPGISDLKGMVSSNINITGQPDNIELGGYADFNNLKLTIDYLKVPLTISSRIKIEKDKFIFDKAALIKDDKGHSAKIQGSLSHNYFKDWSYIASIEDMKNMHILETNAQDNDLFYGSAYADGNARFYGTFEKFNLILNAKSRTGTIITMPIGNDEASGPVSYISFKSDSKDTTKSTTEVENSFLNSLDINLEVTPDMVMQLLLDPQTGERIKGSGQGIISMKLNEDDEFSMHGKVTINKGDYNFIAFNNTVNKKFFVEQGGTILWDGDPLQATIDLLAYNEQKASPNPLLGNFSARTGQDQLTNINAKSEIFIKGNLFNPEITFGLEIPDLVDIGMGELSSVVQRIQSDYDEVSRQVFSLLVFGSFMTPTFITVEGSGLAVDAKSMFNNSIAELISSQIDGWLSQIDDRWLVDFSLTNTTQDQRADMIIKLGRKFADDRFILDVTYGTTQFGYANNSFNMEYLATRDGRFRLKAFSKNQSIYSDANIAAAPVNTFGFGAFYKNEFNSLKKWKVVNISTEDSITQKDTNKVSINIPFENLVPINNIKQKKSEFITFNKFFEEEEKE